MLAIPTITPELQAGEIGMDTDHDQGGIQQIVVVRALPDKGRDQKQHYGGTCAVPPVLSGVLGALAPELMNRHRGTAPF